MVILLICFSAIVSKAQLRVSENVPIGFYGKVVDQEGEAVIGAAVSFDLITSYMAENRTQTTPMTLQTGQNGKFVLAGVTGYGIDKISVQKQGCELSEKTSRGYVFGLKPEYKPNPDNPVIFKMWKIMGKETLVGSRWHGKVACDGATNRFDLLYGSKDTNGDLEVVCSKYPLTEPPPGNAHFDYKFEVAVLGGGIQPTADEFTYRAPEKGYAPAFTVSHKADDPNWLGGIKQEFYIKTASGRYGRLYVEWYASQTPPVHLEWNCSINAFGSHNLER